jgi:isopentenyl diphosphate isomerase/L-lactate dehydrogenase-like FMN-dependent dehydrogenase
MERFIVTVTYPQGAATISSDMSGTSFDMPVRAESMESAQAKAERMAQALAAHLNDPSVGVHVAVKAG